MYCGRQEQQEQPLHALAGRPPVRGDRAARAAGVRRPEVVAWSASPRSTPVAATRARPRSAAVPGSRSTTPGSRPTARWTRRTRRSASPAWRPRAKRTRCWERIQNDLFDLGADLCRPGSLDEGLAHRPVTDQPAGGRDRRPQRAPEAARILRAAGRRARRRSPSSRAHGGPPGRAPDHGAGGDRSRSIRWR